MTLTDHLQPLLDKRFPAALVALVLGVVPAFAGDHLEPVHPVWTGVSGPYPAREIRGIFPDAFASDVVARAFVMEAFSPAYMIGIKRAKSGYAILHLAPSAARQSRRLFDPG